MKKLLIIIILLLTLIIGCTDQKPAECRTNNDCVAATCCHADACVTKEKAPDCEGILCSMECIPYTMDCGQGSCICENNRCVAKIAG